MVEINIEERIASLREEVEEMKPSLVPDYDGIWTDLIVLLERIDKLVEVNENLWILLMFLIKCELERTD